MLKVVFKKNTRGVNVNVKNFMKFLFMTCINRMSPQKVEIPQTGHAMWEVEVYITTVY